MTTNVQRAIHVRAGTCEYCEETSLHAHLLDPDGRPLELVFNHREVLIALTHNHAIVVGPEDEEDKG